MRESGPDEISNARDKAFQTCTKFVRETLLKDGVNDPDDAEAKRRALDWVMDNTSSGGFLQMENKKEHIQMQKTRTET